MRAAAAQCTSVALDVEQNLDTVARLAAAAARAGAGLLVFPELFLTGPTFAPAVWHVAPRPDDTVERRLGRLARDHGVHLVVGSAERRGDDLYNAALLAAPDGTVGRYAKMHLFATEPFTFQPGAGPVIWPTALGRIGVGICYDLLFPTPWTAYAGAVDLCVVPSAWPEFEGSATVVLGLRLPTPARPGVRRVRGWVDDLPPRISAAVGAPLVVANHRGGADVALLDPRAFARLVFAGGSAIHDGAEVVAGAGADDELAVADLPAGARRAGPPYAGVAAGPVGWEVRLALLGLAVAEGVGRAVGYDLVRARARAEARARRPD
ncbi:MAG TPA: carbon-nitrogen hydrolase family protein [Polyangia bacterium]